jgi:aryl-alcohol dehydrogenase-like predicted oxidoreductase
MIKRRQLLQLSASVLAAQSLGLRAQQTDAQTDGKTPIQRPIPSTGELLPVMGMGTSRTFDTAGDEQSLAALTEVMRVFFSAGGQAIDSSPMYGRAETRVGDVLRAMQQTPSLFAATKVWTTGREQGIAQMNESARRMNVERFDLIAVHNLKDWKVQLDTLKNWKQEGKVRYIGITTSHGRDHEQFLQVMRTEPIDFAQFSYNIEDRSAEQHLLPLAAERGIATMINRPYQRGALFSKSRGSELPALAGELGCTSWAQFYLKFILAQPAVTCIIPATASVEHMTDNMQANFGPVPNAQQRAEMLRLFQQL